MSEISLVFLVLRRWSGRTSRTGPTTSLRWCWTGRSPCTARTRSRPSRRWGSRWSSSPPTGMLSCNGAFSFVCGACLAPSAGCPCPRDPSPVSQPGFQPGGECLGLPEQKAPRHGPLQAGNGMSPFCLGSRKRAFRVFLYDPCGPRVNRRWRNSRPGCATQSGS